MIQQVRKSVALGGRLSLLWNSLRTAGGALYYHRGLQRSRRKLREALGPQPSTATQDTASEHVFPLISPNHEARKSSCLLFGRLQIALRVSMRPRGRLTILSGVSYFTHGRRKDTMYDIRKEGNYCFTVYCVRAGISPKRLGLGNL